ncbi:MAG TPA: hypothetical protein VGH86_10520 [Phenylobacterium sp.]
MPRTTRWILKGLAGLAVAAVFAGAGVFAASEAVVRWPQQKAKVELVAASDQGAVARGQRIATVFGCHDCHGADLTGRLFFDEMPVARVAAPNLALAMAHQSDQDLARGRAAAGEDAGSGWAAGRADRQVPLRARALEGLSR